MFLAPIVMWAQAVQVEPALSDIDLSDVVIIEDVAEPVESTRAEPASVLATEELSDAASTPPVDGVTVQVAAMEPATAAPELEVGLDSVGEVVEILDVPTAGVVVDVEAPEILDVATTALPSDSEVVLELPGQETSGPGSAAMAEEETISVDFPDEEVRTILRNVADLFDLNLVIPDTLQGRTSVKLRNITWRQVFEVALGPLGFTYVEDRNIIRIKSIAELTTEPVDTRVFILNYARADDIQGSISPLIDAAAGGKIQVDVRSNALVITERPSRMNKVQEIIERLDKATAQVMIESKFIEVTNTDTKNVGIDWASLSGYGVSAGPFQREWSRNRSSQDDSIRNNTSNNSSNSSSVDGFSLADGPIFSSENEVLSGNGTDFTRTMESLAGTSRLDTALFSADEFQVVLSALNQKDDIKLVSNPTVVTLDNTAAKIVIGEQYPLAQYTYSTEGGESVRQLDGYEFLDIGIKLDVTPHVNSAGFINLDIVPEVSSIIGFVDLEGTDAPRIASRRTETSIMVKDGFTLAIGGLVENIVTNSGSKVPILGDLPGIGRLFSSDSDKIEQRNLIIFITAKTLNPDGSTYRDIIDPRVLHQMGVVPADVPGYVLSPEDLKTLQDIEDFRAQTRRAEAMAEGRTELKAIERAGKQAEKDASKLADEAAAAIAKEPSEPKTIERTGEQDEKDTSKVTAADVAAVDTSSRSNRRLR